MLLLLAPRRAGNQSPSIAITGVLPSAVADEIGDVRSPVIGLPWPRLGRASIAPMPSSASFRHSISVPRRACTERRMSWFR
jgi:hypothetical protein